MKIEKVKDIPIHCWDHGSVVLWIMIQQGSLATGKGGLVSYSILFIIAVIYGNIAMFGCMFHTNSTTSINDKDSGNSCLYKKVINIVFFFMLLFNVTRSQHIITVDT